MHGAEDRLVGGDQVCQPLRVDGLELGASLFELADLLAECLELVADSFLPRIRQELGEVPIGGRKLVLLRVGSGLTKRTLQ